MSKKSFLHKRFMKSILCTEFQSDLKFSKYFFISLVKDLISVAAFFYEIVLILTC